MGYRMAESRPIKRIFKPSRAVKGFLFSITIKYLKSNMGV